MKKISNILLAFAATAALLPALAGNGPGEGYDPTNPPDPDVTYRVRTLNAPSTGGWTSQSAELSPVGASVTVYANPHGNYTFSCWMEGDSLVSKETSYTFTMPEHSVSLTAFYDYTPSSPDDPMADGYTHRVRVYATPSHGGSVYDQSFLLREGESRDIWAYPNSNYRFLGWKHDGQMLSGATDGHLTVTMGKENLEYTAVFAYAPESPSDPGTNSFDNATGVLVIDDFRPGELTSRINDFLDSKQNANPDIYDENVTDVIVTGPCTSYDYHFMAYMRDRLSKCTVVDLSRTTPYSTDDNNNDNYLPWGSFESMPSLVRVALPATLGAIEMYAFNDCPSLSEIVCYATVPPTATVESFNAIPAETVVRVPSEAADLYRNAEGWKNFSVIPLDDESCRIVLTLPEEAADGRYANLTLVLENPASGRVQRLVINDRLEYVFSNLMPDMTYNLYMRDAAGENLASVSEIKTVEKETRTAFESILGFHDLSVKVLDPQGADLTADVDIVWKTAAGDYITTGATAVRIIEGKSAFANVSLPSELGLAYRIPLPVEVVASEGATEGTVTLEPLPARRITGTVTEAGSGTPLAYSFVSVDQMVSGKYKRSVRALTGADGIFEVEFIEADGTTGTIVCGAEGYVNQTQDLANLSGKETCNFTLSPVTGAVMTISLDWLAAGATETVPYADYANVDFTIHNLTTGRPVSDFSNQYPRLVLLDNVNAGDEIELTVSSRTGTFEPQVNTFKVDENLGISAKTTLVEHGAISASHPATSGRGINFMLYDGNGTLRGVTQSDAGNSASFANLGAGSYTLVAIADSRFFNAVNTYDDLAASGLSAGTDFLEATIDVKDGEIAKCVFDAVPEFDESRFFFTKDVILTVNKSSLTVGNYVTVRATVKFKDEYRDDLSDISLRFDLPKYCSYVENSVIRGNEPGNAQIVDGSIRIDGVRDGDAVRFCLTPEAGGEFRPTAFVDFTRDGESFSQPVGSVFFKADEFSIFAPRRTCRESIFVRGVASNLSDVTVFANNIPSGAARSNADGNWIAKVDLMNPVANPLQHIRGEVTDSKGRVFPTKAAVVEYDPYYPELEVVRMIYKGQTVNFDHAKARTDRKSYSYNPSNDMFTLTARFDENRERVDSVSFHILATDGSERVIEGEYIESQQSWVAALGYPDSYRLPVNVTVDFTYTVPVPDPENPETTVDGIREFYVGHIAPDVIPIIDPSGFVYEAVEENRLEGVKCTVFYREMVDNGFGDMEWSVEKWDAAEYAQENPLFTDADGSYAWDVPQGEWQVRFEKEGYETAQSAWLPVPPPQLEVNVGMVQNSCPVVTDAHAFAKGIDITFDKPLQTASVTADNLYVTVADSRIEGSVMTVDAEDGSVATLTERPVSRLRFVPAESLATTTGEIHLFIGNSIKSYAGINMLDNYDAVLTVEKEIEAIKADNTTEVSMETPHVMTVSVLPAEAAAGKTLTIANDSPDLLALSGETQTYILDEKGQAAVTLTGLIPGVARLTFSVNGSDTKGEAKISVVNRTVIALPEATYADGTEIYRGTRVELTCQTPTSVIYYTIDGTDPTVDDKHMYTGPFTIDGGVTVKAIAVANGQQSEVATFTYGLKMSKLELGLCNGWNWISHNLADGVAVASIPTDSVERLLSQDAELIRDPKLGLVGNIDRLEYSQSYKVLASGPAAVSLEDVAVNPATPVRLGKGWNWIGYSSTQTMTPDEAFAEMEAEKDDYILGQEGFASFDGEKWIGELSTLNPGAGYMYRSASEKDLVYNVGIVSKAAARHAAVRSGKNAPWVVDRRKYPSVMPVIADVITPDGRIAAEGEYEVGAFCGTECRGVGVYCEGYLMMSVYGNVGDDITFHLLPAGSEEALVLSDGLTFTETPQGSLDSPMRLDASHATGVHSVAGNGISVSIRDNILTVSGNPERIELYNTDGHKLISVRDGRNSVSLAGLQPGVHMVAVMTSGSWSYHKVMVR